jgi:hypothetical protein
MTKPTLVAGGIWSGGVSPFANEDFMAEMQAFYEDPEGDRV